jgi:death-on-curing protein
VKPPEWVLAETVLALHDQLLAAFGGSGGIRDPGLLESALARPRHLFAYGRPDLFDLAASYGFGLARDHPFVDGNKRTGFTVAATFLELNGYVLEAEEADAVVETLALAAGDRPEAAYAAWLRRHSRRVPRRTRPKVRR